MAWQWLHYGRTTTTRVKLVRPSTGQRPSTLGVIRPHAIGGTPAQRRVEVACAQRWSGKVFL